MTVARNRLVGHLTHGLEGRDVGGAHSRAALTAAGDGLERLFSASDEHDRRATTRRQLGERGANPTACPGDDDDPRIHGPS